MEKDRINILLNNPSEATQDDIHLLDQESEKYPYAQALHILRAKISFLLNEAGKNEKLTRAAIYSADRSVLKKVITEKWYLEQQKHITPFQDLPKFDLNIAPEKTKKEYIIHPEEADSSSIFAEVLKNLEQLKALRQQFQFLELNEDTSEKESPKTNPEPQKSNEVKKEEPKAQKIQEPEKKELKPPDTKKED